MKKIKLICAVVTLAFAAGTVFAQSSDAATSEVSAAESQKIAREQAKAEKAKAAREAKLAKMSDEEKAAFLAQEAEKKAAAEAKAAEKLAAEAEKKAAKEAAEAEKKAAAEEKKAAKEAALKEKLDAMTPEQRAKYEEKEAIKAQLKAEVEADMAMRKATIESTKTKAELPNFTLDIEEGIEIADVSRVILKTERSNFIYKDTLAGAYVNVKTNGLGNVNPMLKVSALMGMGETFNDMKVSTSTFNYAVDGFLGFDYKVNFWNYAFLNLVPGGHVLYQNADRFDYVNLGLGGYISLELPVAYHWTVVLAGQATYDWGNFGTNALLETYDYVWQTGINIGVRFSKGHVNEYNYIGDSAELLKIKKDRADAIKAKAKADKKAKADAKKAAAAEAKAAKGATQE